MKNVGRILALPLLTSILFVSGTVVQAQQAYHVSETDGVQSAHQSPEQLQQLVAPIALYPDNLVGQILAASTYPSQIVQAQRWMQQNRGLRGADLAKAVDQQSWDSSTKALTQFPKVLANMDKNLAWTSTLGDAYVNQQADVLDAVQVMRQHAQTAGNLKTTSQETVTTDDSSISIQPSDPQIVYVPQYDPWVEYGYPVPMYPGWAPYPGLYLAVPGIEFGLGFGFGFYSGFGWGWNNWGMDWHRHNVLYNHDSFISHSPTFARRGSINESNSRAMMSGRLRSGSRTPVGSSSAAGIRSSPPRDTGSRPGAFSGFNHGGFTRTQSARGQTSVGRGYTGGRSSAGAGSQGGGGSRGGGGGSHGGGGRGGHR